MTNDRFGFDVAINDTSRFCVCCYQHRIVTWRQAVSNARCRLANSLRMSPQSLRVPKRSAERREPKGDGQLYADINMERMMCAQREGARDLC